MATGFDQHRGFELADGSHSHTVVIGVGSAFYKFDRVEILDFSRSCLKRSRLVYVDDFVSWLAEVLLPAAA